MITYLIVGLGNPSPEYAKTKHNIGFMVIDRLCKSLNVSLASNKFNGEFIRLQVEDKQFILAKPQTYMNLSGDFVRDISHFYQISSENILVIHDDADTVIGTLKIRQGGSSGGQNGVKDIINKIANDKFIRVKLGIGRPNNKQMSLADYVLSSFGANEWAVVNSKINVVVDALIEFMNGAPISVLMNKYNFKIK